MGPKAPLSEAVRVVTTHESSVNERVCGLRLDKPHAYTPPVQEEVKAMAFDCVVPVVVGLIVSQPPTGNLR
jgi:hypothetical protein